MTPASALVLPPSTRPPAPEPVLLCVAHAPHTSVSAPLPRVPQLSRVSVQQPQSMHATNREWRGHDVDAADWMLDARLFQYLASAYHFIVDDTVDLFASPKNTQTPRYFCAPGQSVHDTVHTCLGADAFAAEWTQFQFLYANPPWTELFHLRREIERRLVDQMIVIMPRSALFGTYSYMHLCVDHPIIRSSYHASGHSSHLISNRRVRVSAHHRQW